MAVPKIAAAAPEIALTEVPDVVVALAAAAAVAADAVHRHLGAASAAASATDKAAAAAAVVAAAVVGAAATLAVAGHPEMLLHALGLVAARVFAAAAAAGSNDAQLCLSTPDAVSIVQGPIQSEGCSQELPHHRTRECQTISICSQHLRDSYNFQELPHTSMLQIGHGGHNRCSHPLGPT